jgi:hypothetical protein
MFNGYERGYEAGYVARGNLIQIVKEQTDETIELLRLELQHAREAYRRLEARFDEQLERANIAADELLLNQGGRRAISIASERLEARIEEKQLKVVEKAEKEASEMFSTRAYTDPDATFASEEDARGEYA